MRSLPKLTIYGDRVSGNCHKVEWAARLSGFDYDWRDVDILAGETRSPEFLALNPAGQVPTISLSDGGALSQSNAIILHLDALAGGRLSPEDPFERAKMLEWLFWEQYTHEKAIAVRRFQKKYLGKPDAEIDPALLSNGNSALARIELALDNRPSAADSAGAWLVGSSFSLADLALLAYTRLAHEGGFDLAHYPHTQSWVARGEAIVDTPSALEKAS
ncbi:MAG: glutathione S-transferase family protein [Parvularculaceae bacterium]